MNNFPVLDPWRNHNTTELKIKMRNMKKMKKYNFLCWIIYIIFNIQKLIKNHNIYFPLCSNTES